MGWWVSGGRCQLASGTLNPTDVFVFDCDGVIWKGDSLIEGVPEPSGGRGCWGHFAISHVIRSQSLEGLQFINIIGHDFTALGLFLCPFDLKVLPPQAMCAGMKHTHRRTTSNEGIFVGFYTSGEQFT